MHTEQVFVPLSDQEKQRRKTKAGNDGPWIRAVLYITRTSHKQHTASTNEHLSLNGQCAWNTSTSLISVTRYENEFKICSPKWQWNVTSLSIQPISYMTPTQPCNSMPACYRYTPLAYCYNDKGIAHTSRTDNKLRKVQNLTQVFFLITQVKKVLVTLITFPKLILICLFQMWKTKIKLSGLLLKQNNNIHFLMHSSKDKNSWRLNFVRWRIAFSALLQQHPPFPPPP
jgi:hypothetical protein